MEVIERIAGCSNYFATLIRRKPEYVRWLVEERNLNRRYPLTGLYQNLLEQSQGAEDFPHLLRIFREFKQMHFLRIGARDLTGLADLAETTSQVSDLACVALQVGLKVLSEQSRLWAPEIDPQSLLRTLEHFPLTIMGLGKLGGQELNYVSDVDLIYFHTPSKGTGAKLWEEPIVLNRLCQWLSRLLSDRAEGDRVFEVDLRLRPQGKDGPLVPSSGMAVEHYLLRGRPWERQMLLKARPVAGNRSLGTAFIHEVRPFVFRRFLDFQALDELRHMRDRILAEAAQVTTGWKGFNVKLGIGGIREIEFLVQSLQLVYGGRHPQLDEPNTLKCIEKLVELELLSSDVARELKEAYVFLRGVEHWVQLDQNRQTQKLPQTPEAMKRLQQALGFHDDEGAFFEKLQDCCMKVHSHFTGLFQFSTTHDGAAQKTSDGPDDSQEVDVEQAYPSDLLEGLRSRLDRFPSQLAETVVSVLHKYSSVKSSNLREKMVVRLDRYFSQVGKRPGLIKVFRPGKPWIAPLCEGLVRCELLADLLGHHPGLVEGVSTVDGVFPDNETWREKSELLVTRAADLEEAMEWLRRLKNERMVQIAIRDIAGDLSYDEVELLLTFLADFVIAHTYERILDHVGLDPSLPLAVLALGKVGSREMGYLSDLDLAFVYDPKPHETQEQIPMEVMRFVQRFMRMLSVPLIDGPGYPVDARLRPTGSYGPLIVTWNNWVEYYGTRADLWEIQALQRVRCVAGHVAMRQWIESEASRVCYVRRSPDEVWGRLCHLRGRMQRERADERADVVDLKLGYGGLTDLEFLVQGSQLIHGWKEPRLRQSRVRDALGAALQHAFDDADITREVCGLHDGLRALEHRLRLYTNLASSRLTPHHLADMRDLGLWPTTGVRNTLENWEDILRARRRIRQMIQYFCPDL